MKTLLFKSSPLVSIGVELEFQIVNPLTYDLISRSESQIKRRVTQSMIEINSSIQLRPSKLENEFAELHDYLLSVAKLEDIKISGCGTHPFEIGSAQKFFPANRYKKLSAMQNQGNKQIAKD
jgi:carboxylate-amine ligase